MSETPTNPATPAAAITLSPRERRVAGVLVEKSRTTPDVYPMTLSAVTTACNQKNNRDPVTNYDQDDVEEALQALRRRGGVIMVDGGGRVPRYKHEFYEWLKVSRAELAVLAELWLRGAQTEGDLRGRAARMEKTLDMPALQAIVAALVERGYMHILTPPEQKRGVVVTHGFYPPDEFAKIKQGFAARLASGEFSVVDDPGLNVPRAAAVDLAAELREEISRLGAELAAVRAAVQSLQDEFASFRSQLGG